MHLMLGGGVFLKPYNLILNSSSKFSQRVSHKIGKTTHTQLTNTARRPELRHWISPYKWPRRDRVAYEHAIVCIIVALSPFIISSTKPESRANSNPFRHASTSASSLSDTGGPFTVMAAITSPNSLQITVPKSKALMSLNIATSKLSLKQFSGGGLQVVPLVAVDWTAKCCYTSLYSSINSTALLTSQEGSCMTPPWVIVFLWFQINQAWTRNNLNSSNDNLFNNSFASYNTSSCPPAHFYSLLVHLTQTPWATLLGFDPCKLDCLT